MKAFYEIILYKDGQLYDHFGRVETLKEGEAIAKRKSLDKDYSYVALAKEVYDDIDDPTREWTRFYKDGRMTDKEQW